MSDASSDTALSQVRLHLGRASGWFRFLGIMGLIGCGVLVVVALVVAFAGMFFPFGMFHSPLIGLAIGFFYLIIAAVVLVAALMLLKLASSSRAFQADGTVTTLETVSLTAWKLVRYYGIVLIVVLAVEILVAVFAVIAMAVWWRGSF